MSESELLELWYTALRTPKGIEVEVTDVVRFRSYMYQARKKAGDERLDQLSLVASPVNPETHVWIAFRTIEVDDAQE